MRSFRSTVALLTSLYASSGLVRAQQFESVSIKQHRAPGGGTGARVRVNGSRVTAAATPLVMVIMYAYDVPRNRISGAPRWTILFGEQSYDFEAKTGGDTPPSPTEVRTMLRTLLAERFQLQVHRENREAPVCSLSVGDKGARLKESTPAESKPASSTPESPVGLKDGIATMNLPRATLARFATRIEPYVQCRTLDQTGLGGTYDISLSWPVSSLSVELSRPAFLAALAEQLGLRVDTLRADSVEMLVIDRVVQPPAN